MAKSKAESVVKIVVGEIEVPSEMTPDEAVALINEARAAGSVAGARCYSAIGSTLIYMRGKLSAPGEFAEWCETKFDWSKQYAHRVMAFHRWWHANATPLKLESNPTDITAYLAISQKQCPKEAYKLLVGRLKKGQVLTTKETTEIIKAHRPAPKKESPYDPDGVASCMRCEKYFKPDGFHDPEHPANCIKCHKEFEIELATEQAEKASSASREVVIEQPGDIMSLWSNADDEERTKFVDELQTSGILVSVEKPKADEGDSDLDMSLEASDADEDADPYEEVMYWWAACSDVERRKLAKKIPWADFLPSKAFIPPTVSEVAAYCAEKKYTFDPEAFHAHYDSNGWKVGGSKATMKSWYSACITWQKSEKAAAKKAFKAPTLEDVRAYTEDLEIDTFSASQFVDHYSANGWKINGTKMNDWKAAVRKWRDRDDKKSKDDAEAEPGMYES